MLDSMEAATFALVALLPLLAACDGNGPTDPDVRALEAAQARWDASGPSSYTYAVRRSCFCPPDYLGPARLRIEQGVVVEQVYVDSGLPVPSSLDFPAVDELFDILRSAYEQGAHEVRVEYDPSLGVPVDFWIDYDQMTVDEELGVEVTEPVESSS